MRTDTPGMNELSQSIANLRRTLTALEMAVEEIAKSSAKSSPTQTLKRRADCETKEPSN